MTQATGPSQYEATALQGGNGKLSPGALSVALARDFGGLDAWKEAFTAAATARGTGCVVLCWSRSKARLVNEPAAAPQQLHSDLVPLLAWDMAAHARRTDGTHQAAGDMESFMANLQWSAVESRYAAAIEADSAGLGVRPEGLGDFDSSVLLDVRREEAFLKSHEIAQGARWMDPARVAAWACAIERTSTIVVYCVHGHEVSRATALQLRALGCDARFLEGGLSGWKAANMPVSPRDASPGLGITAV